MGVLVFAQAVETSRPHQRSFPPPALSALPSIPGLSSGPVLCFRMSHLQNKLRMKEQECKLYLRGQLWQCRLLVPLVVGIPGRGWQEETFGESWSGVGGVREALLNQLQAVGL